MIRCFLLEGKCHWIGVCRVAFCSSTLLCCLIVWRHRGSSRGVVRMSIDKSDDAATLTIANQRNLSNTVIVPRKRKITTFNSKLPFEVKFTNKTAIIQKYCTRFLLSHRQNSCVVLIIITQNHLKLSQDERKTKKINRYNLMKVSFEAQMKDQYAMANCNGSSVKSATSQHQLNPYWTKCNDFIQILVRKSCKRLRYGRQ